MNHTAAAAARLVARNTLRPAATSHVRPLAIATFGRAWPCSVCVRPPSPSTSAFSTTSFRSEAPSRTPFDPKPPESAGKPVVPSTTADLPSQTDQRRWQISRRMASLMDGILARASIAGQHINVYTGTDYSGIEAIKKEISEQEDKVDSLHATINAARSGHHEAHAKQASSQKEIVSLLERKSSWSPEDLERYMSLVRSEHVDEQAVQAAKEDLAAAERDLENARAELERLERKQYHEEQIWSDTIRRNSTWVTFGLMGLNIILLLAQIAVFEPYRRRKIVKEVRQQLDEKAASVAALSVERQIAPVPDPTPGVSLEVVEQLPPPDATESPTKTDERGASKLPLAVENNLLAEAAQVSGTAVGPGSKPGSWSERWEAQKESLRDLFSERVVQVKKVDLTTTALQGAATGVAAMGLLFVLWRPK